MLQLALRRRTFAEDELIRTLQGAHNALMDLEDLSQEDLDRIRASYQELAEGARKDLRRGRRDTGRPELPRGSGSVRKAKVKG